MPSKNSHPIGTAKQDPETKSVAVRCKNGLPGEWAVMTIGNGGHFASNEDVADWPVMAPRLDAAKVESGIVPGLNASKIPAGTLNKDDDK